MSCFNRTERTVYVRGGSTSMTPFDAESITSISPAVLRSLKGRPGETYYDAGVYVDEGTGQPPKLVDFVAWKGMKVLLPAVDDAIKRAGLGSTKVTQVVLIGIDTKTAKRFTDNIKHSLAFAWRQEIDVEFKTPLTTYYETANAARNPGRLDIDQAMTKRVQKILNPNLQYKQLFISKQDWIIVANYNRTDELYCAVIEALAEATACGALKNGDDLVEVEKQYPQIYQDRMVAMAEWYAGN